MFKKEINNIYYEFIKLNQHIEFRAVRILNAGFNDKKNIYRFTH